MDSAAAAGTTESWDDIASPFRGSIKRASNKRKHSTSIDEMNGRKDAKRAKESISDVSDDTEVAHTSSMDLHFSISQIARIVQDLRTKIRLKKRNMSRKFLAFSDFSDIELPPGGTNEMLKSDLRRCIREATMLSNMTVPMAFELLHVFLEEGHSITMDPSFPKKPPTGFSIFMRKTGQNRFSSDGNAMWRNDSFAAEKAAAEKEASQLMEKYLADLHAYRDAHPELTRAHRDYLDNAVLSAHKAINKSKGVKEIQSNKKSVAKKEARSPFELFALGMAKKYADLDPDKREKKLRKKFEKLSDSEREIYETLAVSL